MERITGLTPWLVPGRLTARWTTIGQRRARRNAMIASEELSTLRLERAEVAEYVARALAAREARLAG